MRVIRTAGKIGAALLLATLVAGAMVAPGTAVAQSSAAPSLATLSTSLSIGGNGQPDTQIVYAELPSTAKLPATVSVAVPSGATLDWVGEILGGDPSQDPTATYTITRDGGHDVITVTLQRVPRAQIEMSVPAKGAGAAQKYVLAQPIIGPVATASLSFQVPSGSTLTQQSAGLVKDGSANGADRYTVTRSNPKSGSTLTASITANVIAASQSPSTGQSNGQSAGQQLPATASQPQGQQPSSTSASGGSLWMTLGVVGSLIFFLYNLQKYRQLKSTEHNVVSVRDHRHAEPKAKARSDAARTDSGQKGRPGSTAPDAAAARELKSLGDRRSRGELSREEYLAKKNQLLAG